MKIKVYILILIILTAVTTDATAFFQKLDGIEPDIIEETNGFIIDSSLTFRYLQSDSVPESKVKYSWDNENNIVSEAFFSWDSVYNMWIQTHSIRYYRNQSDNETEIIKIQYDTNGAIKDGTKEVIKLNIVNQIFTIVTYKFVNQEWKYYKKTEYMYDMYGNLISYKVSYFDKLTGWILDKAIRHDIIYNEKSNIVAKTKYEYNKVLNVYVPVDKYIFDYDEAGNINVDSYYIWIYQKKYWHGEYKKSYVFDNRNNLKDSVIYEWDDKERTWIYNYKASYSYDIHNNHLTYTQYVWNYSRWDTLYHYIYLNTYEKTNKLKQKIEFRVINKDTIPTKKNNYDYSESGKIIFMGTYFYNRTDSNWIAQKKILQNYDSKDSLISKEIYLYDTERQIWKPDEKFEFRYDIFKNQTLNAYFKGIDDTWVEIYAYVNEYNEDNNKVLQIVRDTIKGDKKIFIYNRNKLKIAEIEEETNNPPENWVVKQKTFFYYTPLEHYENIGKKEAINCYPVPTQGRLTVSCSKIGLFDAYIYDTNGIVKKKFKIHWGDNNIDISDLPNGMYFIQVMFDNIYYESKRVIKISQ